MYSTCIFCHLNLGTNESVEHFPVGRRLAFDAARGRLWVVCRKCERWNLSPLDERWEAIEECERLFTGTRTRVSTDNIGLARIRDGLELVRIGSPQRPEMAAWRYGDQFGRRRTKHLVLTGAAITAAVGLVVLGPATGLVAGGGWGIWNVASSLNSVYRARRVRARLVLPGEPNVVRVRLQHLNRITLIGEGDDWALRVPFETRAASTPGHARFVDASGGVSTVLKGEDALRVAAQLLPAINASGAKRAEVDDAVRMVGDAADPSTLFKRYATPGTFLKAARRRDTRDDGGRIISRLPKEVRLALEMATHEESERRALEGELALLEAAWQNAEEIAAISDDMLVSDETRAKISELKRAGDGAGGD
jgi:hypothetical protein